MINDHKELCLQGIVQNLLPQKSQLRDSNDTVDACCVSLLSQVPQDEWGGYPTGGKDEEIPCRRMRSGSYIKAMGDEESGESDSSPKTSPKTAIRPEPLLRSLSQRPLGDLQT